MCICRKNPDLFGELAKGQSPKVSNSYAYSFFFWVLATTGVML